MRLHCSGVGSPISESRLERRDASRAKLPVAPERRRWSRPDGGAGLTGDRGLLGVIGLLGLLGLMGVAQVGVGEWHGLRLK